MLIGRKVKMLKAEIGKCRKGQIAEVTYVCDCNTRVLLNIGYFWNIKDLNFIDKDLNEDPLLFSKCIEKHGTLIKALKKSL